MNDQWMKIFKEQSDYFQKMANNDLKKAKYWLMALAAFIILLFTIGLSC